MASQTLKILTEISPLCLKSAHTEPPQPTSSNNCVNFGKYDLDVHVIHIGAEKKVKSPEDTLHSIENQAGKRTKIIYIMLMM